MGRRNQLEWSLSSPVLKILMPFVKLVKLDHLAAAWATGDFKFLAHLVP
jgi:hypothetical protein